MSAPRFLAVLVLLGQAGCSSSEPDAGETNRQLAEGAKLHIAGDSTAATFPETDATGRVGWGAVIGERFQEGFIVDNAARSGRSSKSFIDEGFWASLKNNVRAGSYVFIQFGHNDEKLEDATRYTNPATTFREHLRVYIDDTRALGATPVLLTPIERRKFSGGVVIATHGAYPAAMAEVAEETDTPLIDMTAKTKMWLESLGPTASVEYFAESDDTHTATAGAREVAALVVEGILELELPLSQALPE